VLVNWKQKSFAVSDDGGTISVAVKTQGQHGVFALEGDTLMYLRSTEGKFTDQGVLTLVEGSSTVEITVQIDTLYWKQVSAGQYYTMAIKSDGTLWGWGANNYGQLGDGTTVNRNAPVQIGNDTHWKKVYAKFIHTMAIKEDGTLWGWGYNRFGALGNGTNSDKHIPTQEPSRSTNWTDVATGYYHSVAIKSDGTLWASGRNNYGQLGDNTLVDKHVFVPIAAAVTDWSDVAAGIYHSAAIRQDGSLWAWGRNNYGQIGDGTVTDKQIPTQEALADMDWKKVSTGYNHTVAIKTDGTLFAWGYNNYAVIGDGVRVSHNVPTQEASAAEDWVEVDGGNYHTVAIKSDGTLWGWGYNNYGQLTDGISAWRYAPEVIGGEEKWSQASASQYHTAALKESNSVLLWGAVAGARDMASD
jgi:alpha-tubulin suppressor-like RCC1 family protein